MGELKPCAWCRSKRKPWYKYGTNSCKWGAAVCSDCGAQAPEVRTGYDESENAPWHEDADREWNTRAASEAVELLRELKQILAEYANDDNYSTSTQSYDGKYISNGVTEETYYEFDGDSSGAKKGLEIVDKLLTTPAKPAPRTSYHWLEVAASRIKAGEPEQQVMEDYGYSKLQQPAECPIEESGTISEKDWDNLETKLRQQPKEQPNE